MRVLVLLFPLLLSACSTDGGAAVGAIAAVTAIGGMAPAQEIEQVYFLGVFDPQEQLPRAVYRISVRGQSSFLSGMRFNSGWVPAAVVDSLSGELSFSSAKGLGVKGGAGAMPVSLQTGRRLVVFGPEGFREVPRDHRLVLVMGANPEGWFQAVDQALGSFGMKLSAASKSDLRATLIEEIATLRGERQRLDDLQRDVEEGAPR